MNTIFNVNFGFRLILAMMVSAGTVYSLGAEAGMGISKPKKDNSSSTAQGDSSAS